MQVPAGDYPVRLLVLLLCFCVFDLLKGKELQVRHGAKSESSRIEIDKYESAKCCCMVYVEMECFEHLNVKTFVCRENCEIHEMREIREEHDVKSSKQ